MMNAVDYFTDMDMHFPADFQDTSRYFMYLFPEYATQPGVLHQVIPAVCDHERALDTTFYTVIPGAETDPDLASFNHEKLESRFKNFPVHQHIDINDPEKMALLCGREVTGKIIRGSLQSHVKRNGSYKIARIAFHFEADDPTLGIFRVKMSAQVHPDRENIFSFTLEQPKEEIDELMAEIEDEGYDIVDDDLLWSIDYTEYISQKKDARAIENAPLRPTFQFSKTSLQSNFDGLRNAAASEDEDQDC